MLALCSVTIINVPVASSDPQQEHAVQHVKHFYLCLNLLHIKDAQHVMRFCPFVICHLTQVLILYVA